MKFFKHPSISQFTTLFTTPVTCLLLIAGLATMPANAATDSATDPATNALNDATPEAISESETDTVLSPVLVKSSLDKQNGPVSKSSGSIVHKDAFQIKEKTATRLSDTLNFEPNIEFIGGPRGTAELPQIRGLGAERILILEDGVRQNFQSGHNGRIFSDFSLTENVEVVKGPWSSLYGSGAMGGVISFQRSTAADFIKKSGRDLGFELGLDGYSAGEEASGRVTAFAKAGSFEPLISVRSSNSQNLRLGGGDRLAYSAEASQDIYGSFGFELGPHHQLDVKVNSFQKSGETPLNPTIETSAINKLSDMTSKKQDIIFDYRLESGNSDFHAKPYYRKTSVDKKRLTNGITDAETVETIGVDMWNTLHHTLSASLSSTITIGAEYFQDTNTGSTGGAKLKSFPNGTDQQYGIYLQPAFTAFESWTITPGLRFDSYENKSSDASLAKNSGEKLSMKLYSSYEFSENKMLYAGWGQAFNAPRLQDLYITDMHFPGNFFIPNPNLKPETAETFEVGTKNKFLVSDEATLQANASVFLTETKDFINRTVDFAGGTTVMQNLDEVELYGLEAQVYYQTAIWGTGLSYGQVISRDKIHDTPLADTPADTWTARLEWIGIENLSLGTDIKWYEKQTRVPTGVDESGEAYTQDIFATWLQRNYEVRFRVNNVFDRSFIKHGSGIKEIGRDFRLNLSYLF